MNERKRQAGALICIAAVALIIWHISISSNVAAGFSALFSFGLLVVSIVAARTALRNLRQLREDSRDRTRPMMAAELRLVPGRRGIQILVIRNYGPSVARNVKVTFDPPLPSVPLEQSEKSIIAALKDRYAEPLSAIVPGVEYDNIWFLGESKDSGKFVNKVDLPDLFSVKISYTGSDADSKSDPYSDSFELNTTILLKRTYAEPST